jgi:hypothetical protein
MDDDMARDSLALAMLAAWLGVNVDPVAAEHARSHLPRHDAALEARGRGCATVQSKTAFISEGMLLLK